MPDARTLLITGGSRGIGAATARLAAAAGYNVAITYVSNEAAADAVDVGIHHYAFVFLEPGAQDDVRGLAGYSGQSEKLVHLIWDLTAK